MREGCGWGCGGGGGGGGGEGGEGGEGGGGGGGGEGGEGGGGGWRGWSCWGSNKTLFSSLFGRWVSACGRFWGGVGVAGGGEGTVRPCLCRGCGWWAVSAVFGVRL